MDIVANVKAPTEARGHVHLGKVMAHVGVEGNILADAAAKKVVTQKIDDAGGHLNAIQDEDPEAAGIDATCDVSNAHEHHGHGGYGNKGPFTLLPSMKAWTRRLS